MKEKFKLYALTSRGGKKFFAWVWASIHFHKDIYTDRIPFKISYDTLENHWYFGRPGTRWIEDEFISVSKSAIIRNYCRMQYKSLNSCMRQMQDARNNLEKIRAAEDEVHPNES